MSIPYFDCFNRVYLSPIFVWMAIAMFLDCFVYLKYFDYLDGAC